MKQKVKITIIPETIEGWIRFLQSKFNLEFTQAEKRAREIILDGEKTVIDLSSEN